MASARCDDEGVATSTTREQHATESLIASFFQEFTALMQGDAGCVCVFLACLCVHVCVCICACIVCVCECICARKSVLMFACMLRVVNVRTMACVRVHVAVSATV